MNDLIARSNPDGSTRRQKLLLIYPPMTTPTSPPLGAPMLKGYIERELPNWEVKVLDLNIWCYERVFEMLRSGFIRIPDEYLPGGQSALASLLEVPDFFRGKTARDFYADPAAYDQYGELLLGITHIMSTQLGNEANSIHQGAGLSPLLAEAFKLILEEKADCYGFSMIFNQQLPVGAALGRLLRQETTSKVFFGGSCFTAGAEDFLRWYPHSADVIVDGDGEEPLKQLLLQGGSPENVPGAVFFEDGEVKRNTSEYRRDIDAYGKPDFGNLQLDRYYSPTPVIPLLLSRGCYWRRCTFCVHYMSAGLTYRLHGLEMVIDMLRGFVEQGIRHFSFVDEMIAPGHFAKLADAIIESGLDISYYALSKPNRTFTPEILAKMARSGCKYLLWGLESGTQRILDLMDKGTRIEDVAQVLRNAHSAGIANHVYVICGFPTETAEEFGNTLRFLEENREYIYSIHRGTFSLEPGSPIYKEQERFGVTRAWMAQPTPLGGRWLHETVSGMNREQTQNIFQSVQPFFRRFNPYAVYLANYRDHAMLVYDKLGAEAMKQMPREFPALNLSVAPSGVQATTADLLS
ncbi:B12-binding domain-containing radical SAM protein [Pseudomonas multiresinivorans]|uniref:B12-binding domain-containing radical SAM protein n=1 Tax=Pseudomonas multiresinivorans TaxID=95301 RepID=A0A7Z3GPH5_9PSED|nr:radical SAM protein [Pseudomonas multiresinivorans]QJP08115.1 B12-binding domain-containing radical SAM protein [Pseudomonas multiresinivorans]